MVEAKLMFDTALELVSGDESLTSTVNGYLKDIDRSYTYTSGSSVGRNPCGLDFFW